LVKIGCAMGAGIGWPEPLRDPSSCPIRDHQQRTPLDTDIAQVILLTRVAGLGHWMLGSIDWHLLGSLLAGSLPGIVIGSYFSVRVPETVLRVTLATTLLLVAGKLAL
jgi:uncharacterized membrane protein YfcA